MNRSDLNARATANERTTDGIAQFLIDAFPKMTPGEQHLSLALYRELAQGKPVAPARLARAAMWDLEPARQLLARWPGVFFDDRVRVIGFWGLSIKPTQHRFEVAGKMLYTWCAWDALFIPQLLDRTAVVTSSCAGSGQRIELIVSPDRIESAEPAATFLSFLLPDQSAIERDVTRNFCRFVRFFRSRVDGERWVRQHPDTFVVPVDQAFVIGHDHNAARYSGTLKERGIRA